MSRTILVEGSVSVTGTGNLARAQVQIDCVTCGPEDEPLASGITDAAGHFRVRLRDPGIVP